MKFELRRRDVVVSRAVWANFTDHFNLFNFPKICIFDPNPSKVKFQLRRRDAVVLRANWTNFTDHVNFLIFEKYAFLTLTLA